MKTTHWQVGILPETGGSIAFGRVRSGDTFIDVLRPTAESDFGNASLCASFIMLPWANRLRDAHFRFRSVDYALQPTSADGSAIYGAVRKLAWRVVSADAAHVRLSFDSALHENLNYPFEFSAEAEYRLDGRVFVLRLTLKNEDKQPMPGGFGHHPYFVTTPSGDANRVQLQIPCEQEFTLIDDLPDAPPHPITPLPDYRMLRTLGPEAYDHLLTGRQDNKPMRIVYPESGVELEFSADPIFEHVVVFAPPGKPFFALEPQTNANDGFNLCRARHHARRGVRAGGGRGQVGDVPPEARLN